MEDLEAKKSEEPMKVESEDKEGSKDSPDTSTPKEEEPVKKDAVEKEPSEIYSNNLSKQIIIVQIEIDLERLAAENTAAKRLLDQWNVLPEVFRIPKKERKEQIREHEREAGKPKIVFYFWPRYHISVERSYQTYLENRGYRAEYNENNDRSRQERYRGSVSVNTTAPSSFKRDRDIRSDTHRKPLRPERFEDR